MPPRLPFCCSSGSPSRFARPRVDFATHTRSIHSQRPSAVLRPAAPRSTVCGRRLQSDPLLDGTNQSLYGRVLNGAEDGQPQAILDLAFESEGSREILRSESARQANDEPRDDG